MTTNWTAIGAAVRLAAALLAVALASAGAPSLADAGNWMQVSCVNPDGSSAPSDGWTSSTAGSPGYGSDNSTSCAPSSPMFAILSTAAPAPVGASETVQYTPPSGSMLVGGSVDVNLYADGGEPNASGTAILYTPAFKYDAGDVLLQCAWGLGPCSSGANPHDFSGVVSLPANRGGNFYVSAGCGGAAGYACSQGGSNGAWSLAQLQWAKFLLANGASPEGSGFGGSLLSPGAFGTADVSFTVTDPGGPGVYKVLVQLDGNTVFAATPDTNSGRCVPVGTDTTTGALMFDWQQPCPPSESVDVPVDTAGLRDGSHQLKISATDAAQNTSTVLNRTITTQRTGTGTISTPKPRRRPDRVKAKLLIRWRYTGARTRLLSVKARHLPRNARVTVRCLGRGCPRPSVRAARAADVGLLWKALAGQVLRARDREIFTITAPGRSPERIELLIRADAAPIAKLL